MIIVVLLLRLTHIVAGAFWVGAAVAYFLYFEPSAKGLGPARSKFMEELIGKHRYPVFMNTTSMLTVLAGLALYLISSNGLSLAWITSGPGLGFTLGSLAALVAFGIGFFGIRPRAARMGALGAAVAAAGGPPTPEQGAELGRLDAEMRTFERWDVGLLVVSLGLMAISRHIG